MALEQQRLQQEELAAAAAAAASEQAVKRPARAKRGTAVVEPAPELEAGVAAEKSEVVVGTMLPEPQLGEAPVGKQQRTHKGGRKRKSAADTGGAHIPPPVDMAAGGQEACTGTARTPAAHQQPAVKQPRGNKKQRTAAVADINDSPATCQQPTRTPNAAAADPAASCFDYMDLATSVKLRKRGGHTAAAAASNTQHAPVAAAPVRPTAVGVTASQSLPVAPLTGPRVTRSRAKA
jgi:hypothetical protein